MKNIFEGAKFGDKFVNRVGKIFIFQKIDSNNYATLFSENSVWSCPLDGKNGEVENEFDIIGKYQDTINEDKLDDLAHKHCKNNGYSNIDEDEYIAGGTDKWGDIMYDIEEAYKAGYRKAKED